MEQPIDITIDRKYWESIIRVYKSCKLPIGMMVIYLPDLTFENLYRWPRPLIKLTVEGLKPTKPEPILQLFHDRYLKNVNFSESADRIVGTMGMHHLKREIEIGSETVYVRYKPDESNVLQRTQLGNFPVEICDTFQVVNNIRRQPRKEWIH